MDAAWILLVLVAAGASSQPAQDGRTSVTQPVEHTVYFAGQSNWSGAPTSAPPAVSYDRYGQPIAPVAPTGQAITDRTQSAFSQTGTALKEGFDAGVRAANQQISSSNPFATSTAAPTINAGSTSGVSSPWASNSATASSPPAWQSTPTASSASAPAAWTSIGSSIAAPPLLVPQSPMSGPSYGPTTATTGRNGPNFPAIAASEQQPLHSVLREPSGSAANGSTSRADDLAAGWGDNAGVQQPSIGATGSQPSLGSTVRESDLVPLPVSNNATQDQRYRGAAPATSNWNNGSWPQQTQPSVTSQPTIESASSNRLQLPSPPSNNGMTGSAVSSPFATQSATQPQTAAQMPQMPNYNTVGTNPNMYQPNNGVNQNSNTQKAGSTPSDQPWMPLILAVLTLAGSLAANLFLGMSYLDARQKYQSLVRKTADTFRRVKAAAA